MGSQETPKHKKVQTMQDMAATSRRHDGFQQVLGHDTIDGGATSVEDDVAIDSDLEGLFEDEEENGEGAVPGWKAPGVEEKEELSTGVVAGAGIGGDSDTDSVSDFSLDEEGAAESEEEEEAAAAAAVTEGEDGQGAAVEEYELDLDDILDRLWNDSLRTSDKSAIQEILRYVAEHGMTDSEEGSVAGSTTSTTTTTTTTSVAAKATHQSCAVGDQNVGHYTPAATAKTARTRASKTTAKVKSAAPVSAATPASSSAKPAEKRASGQEKFRAWTDEEDQLGRDFMMSVVDGGDRSEARFEKTAAFLTSRGFDRTRYSVRNRCNRSWRGPHWDDRKPTADGTQRAFVTSARASAKQAQLAKIGVLVADEAEEAAEQQQQPAKHPAKTKTRERKRKVADEDEKEDESKDEDEDLEEGEVREPAPKRSRTSAASGVPLSPDSPAPARGHWRPRTGKQKRIPDPIKVQQARFDGLSRLDNRSGR